MGYARTLNYTAILDVYSLEQILEYNDLSPEDALAFMVGEDYITLPEVTPISFDD